MPVPTLSCGSTHTLRAEMNGAEMHVFADNSLARERSEGSDGARLRWPLRHSFRQRSITDRLRTGKLLKEQGPGCRGDESE
jgi:hypothetical protein